MGIVVICRTCNESYRSGYERIDRPSDNLFSQPKVLYIFGSLAILSGILCFFLEKDIFVGINYTWKIPLYAIMGISFIFVFIFIISDCINYCSLACSDENAIPIISSNQQVYLLTGIAILMGFLYGILFGIMDVEDASIFKMKVVAMKDQKYCYPIGIILGFIGGFLNQYMRENGGKLFYGDQNQFEEEI